MNYDKLNDIIEHIDLSSIDISEHIDALDRRLLKGKFDFLGQVPFNKSLIERLKPFQELIRVSNLKLSELTAIKARIYHFWEIWQHSEISELLKLTNELIKEQKANKEQYLYEIEQIKEM